MMLFRKIVFWLHLGGGVFAGAVILVMSVTGVLLTYEKQLITWDELPGISVPAGATEPLPLRRLIGSVPGEPSSITIRRGAEAPVAFGFGRESTVYVNPYTAELVEKESLGLRSFFRAVIVWHRWLGATGEGRNTGRAITGACNLAFLFLVGSGFYRWWPRQWKWSAARSVVWFRGGLRGKARDFNWHNVIGFWCCAPLFLVVFSGAVISYPWMSDLVYRAVGDEPPQPNGLRGAGGSSGSRGGGGPEGGHGVRETAPPDLDGIEPLLARAYQASPGWRTITFPVPRTGQESVAFSIDRGSGGQPHLSSTLTLRRASGEVMGHETFAGNSPGRRARMILRFVHTGEIGGVAGQTIAGVASLGAVLLVYTGIALATRRFAGWLARRRRGDIAAGQARRNREREPELQSR